MKSIIRALKTVSWKNASRLQRSQAISLGLAAVAVAGLALVPLMGD